MLYIFATLSFIIIIFFFGGYYIHDNLHKNNIEKGTSKQTNKQTLHTQKYVLFIQNFR